MQTKGGSAKDVLEELKTLKSKDVRYDSGRILCSMCTKPHPIAQRAYRMFLESNLGDPGLFPGSVQLEKEAIEQLASLMHDRNAAGFLVSGGTEANLLAVLAARNMVNVENPEVILPDSAHFSFQKICNQLNLKAIYAPLDGAFKVIPSEVEKRITKNTIAIVGTAGTTELGLVDPIAELSEIALRHSVWLHVDAAFGGLVIPFLEARWNFDFGLRGVMSITVDPHKMGMAAAPTGGILFRNEKALDYLKTETPYLTDNAQYTFIGTRPGASAASTWAVFKNLGFEGFKKVVDKCMHSTQLLSNGLEGLGYKLVVPPTLNIVAFRSKNTRALAEELRKKGWFVSYVPRYDCLRVVVMPHVKRRHVEAFLADLRGISP